MEAGDDVGQEKCGLVCGSLESAPKLFIAKTLTPAQVGSVEAKCTKKAADPEGTAAQVSAGVPKK
jgi:hypothetical protein